MHGDASDIQPGGRFYRCACSACRLTRDFATFRDDLPPERPPAINTRLEAAAFLRWLAAQYMISADASKAVLDRREVNS